MSYDEAAPQRAIRNISDTARWAALHRARESERPDALFRDPFARMLAGERGAQIGSAMGGSDSREWPWAMRTLVFDEFIAQQIAAGVDMVINLAAGFDARPCRMQLPPSLQWIEVDLPELLEEKEKALSGARPHCVLERVRLDLADVAGRRALFERLAQRATKAMVICEGLLIYLSPDDVAALGQDLAAQPSFRFWAADLCSPGLLRVLQKEIGAQVSAGNAPFKFAPAEGPMFFQASGWTPLQVRSLLRTAAQHRRLPWLLRLVAMLPESNGRQGGRPWGGVCLLHRGT